MESTISLLTAAVLIEGIAIIFLALRMRALEKYVSFGFEQVNKTFKSVVDIIKGITNKSMN